MFSILTELAKPTMLSYGNESEYYFPTPCPYPSALATRRLLQARKAERAMKGWGRCREKEKKGSQNGSITERLQCNVEGAPKGVDERKGNERQTEWVD